MSDGACVDGDGVDDVRVGGGDGLLRVYGVRDDEPFYRLTQRLNLSRHYFVALPIACVWQRGDDELCDT